MFIRTREEALDALAAILELPERRVQIIRCTVGIMSCLDPEHRDFFADCQAMLVEGGLEGLKRRRREIREELADNDLLVVIDEEENRALEEIASAFDALRLSDIVREIFPALTTRFEPWEVARAMLANEAGIHEQIRIALRLRRGAATQEEYDRAYAAVRTHIEAHLPAWHERVSAVRDACRAIVRRARLSDPALIDVEAELLFSLVATSDTRAEPLCRSLTRNPGEAITHLERLHELSVTIRALDEQAQAPARNVA